MDDSRRRPRLPFAVRVVLRFGERVIETDTRDVTMEGLLVACSTPPAVDSVGDVAIVLSGGLDDVPLHARARVVRHVHGDDGDVAGMGLLFTEMADGAQALLWRVIRHNTPSGGAAGAGPS